MLYIIIFTTLTNTQTCKSWATTTIITIYIMMNSSVSMELVIGWRFNLKITFSTYIIEFTCCNQLANTVELLFSSVWESYYGILSKLIICNAKTVMNSLLSIWNYLYWSHPLLYSAYCRPWKKKVFYILFWFTYNTISGFCFWLHAELHLYNVREGS